MSERKVILYISMSMDGFIATKNDDLSWLSQVEREGEDYGYAAFTAGIDTYLVGRKTYEKVVEMVGEFPQKKDYQCYVITRRSIPAEENLVFYNGDIAKLIQRLKSEPGKDIYCDGGAEIVKLLMDRDLIDEFIISIIPTILGDGKRLFIGESIPHTIELVDTKTFDSGLVQLHYKRQPE